MTINTCFQQRLEGFRIEALSSFVTALALISAAMTLIICADLRSAMILATIVFIAMLMPSRVPP